MKYLKLFIKKLLRMILKPLSFVPAFLVMYMIFTFSSQEGALSSQLSLKISTHIVTITDEAFDFHLTENQIEQSVGHIHYYVRKLGHVTEYFILAVTFSLPLYVYGLRGLALLIFSGAFCIGFAGLDEFHQSFVAGRTATVKDVAIDSIGVAIGIIFTQITGFLGRISIFKPLSNTR